MCKARIERKEGAAIVESCLAIIMLCLILFGLLQVSYVIMAKDVISYSALASARALAVGMSEEFVERVAHVTTIPTAGPAYSTGGMYDDSLSTGGKTLGEIWDAAVSSSPASRQYWYEDEMIPYYLGADDESMLDGVLNYFYWVTSESEVAAESSEAGDEYAEVTVSQNVPLSYPFAAVFFFNNDYATVLGSEGGGAFVYKEVPVYTIEQNITLENHSVLYLTEE